MIQPAVVHDPGVHDGINTGLLSFGIMLVSKTLDPNKSASDLSASQLRWVGHPNRSCWGPKIRMATNTLMPIGHPKPLQLEKESLSLPRSSFL